MVIDEKPAIAHSKVMIIDQTVAITGSFNFTSAANWLTRSAASVAFIPKDERQQP